MERQQYTQRLAQLTYAERQRAGGRFPAVLRFASVHPRDVAKIIAHAERRIGDVSHIDASRSHLNRVLVGEDLNRPGKTNISADVMKMYEQVRDANHASNLRGLLNSGRKKDHKRAVMRGPQEPWTAQKKHRGPLREGVLTLHRDAFRAAEDCPSEHVLEFLDDEGEIARFDRRICDGFVDASMGFLTHHFADQMPYCRVDFDEQSVHLQFLLIDMIDEDPSTRYASGRTLFRLTQHPLIGGDSKKRGYELAQDAVGNWFGQEQFAHLNVVRAEPRAAARREAAAKIGEMRETAEMDQFFGNEDALPDGSKNAQAMWLLKQKMAEATTEKGGDASKIRKDQAQNLALDFLCECGVVSDHDRHEASTRRARQALLDRHEEAFGTAAEIIAAPDEAVRKAASLFRSEQQKSSDRIAAEERAAAERRAEADRAAAAERKRLDEEATADRKRREKEVILREQKLADEVREVAHQRTLIEQAWDQLNALGEQVRAAARAMGVSQNPIVKSGVEAAKKLAGYRRNQGDDPRS